jgi:hypothetical protein|tara:strand:- start:1025 stop:2218 length:1194 start_codon:yes stop_codon:yes gene_type:complete
MAKYAQMNPGKYHLGYRFPTPVLIEKLPMHVEDEYKVELKYKHAVIVNRTAYVANVQVFSRRRGSIKIESDAMYKSVVNQFDSFPSFNKIEAAVNDGEEITALAEYGDKIFQYKKNTLYCINVGGQIEFLESKHAHKGVNNSAAVCRTDFGIAWVNKHGCYLYDGQDIKNLLEKQGIQRISEDTWSSFISTYSPMIGYLPKKRQLIVVDSSTSAGNGSCYIYNMVTSSWTKGHSATFSSSTLSNFLNDYNGDLVHVDSLTPKTWSDSSATQSNISLKTMDIDFGNPSVRKKVYKIYLSYKGNGSAITIGYRINGETSATLGNFYKINSDGSSSNATDSTTPLHSSSVGTTDWLKAELKPVNSINNINSFQLVIGGSSTDANFAINDMSIIFRVKSTK